MPQEQLNLEVYDLQDNYQYDRKYNFSSLNSFQRGSKQLNWCLSVPSIRSMGGDQEKCHSLKQIEAKNSHNTF